MRAISGKTLRRLCFVSLLAGGPLNQPIPAAAQVGFADTSFGAGGVSLADFDLSGPAVDEAYAITTTPDGKIVAVGKAATGSGCNAIAVAKIQANGSYDPTFGPNHDGRFTFQYPGTCYNVAFAVAIDDLGAFGYEILVAANVQTPSVPSFPSRVVVLRMTADGTPDSLFGNHKPAGYQDVLVARGPTNNNATGSAMAVDANHRIFVAGSATSPSDTQGFVIRLQTEGNPDGGFGNAGVSILGFGDGNSHVSAMTFTGDGSIVLAGETANQAPGLAKLAPSGSYAAAFGNGGHNFFPINATMTFSSVAVDSAGRIVTSGQYTQGATNAFVWRYSADGKNVDADQTLHYTNNGAEASTVEGMVLQADGKILVAGQSVLQLAGVSGLGAGVARFLPDPLTPDPSFGNGGAYLLDASPNGGAFIIPHGVALDGNGKLLVAGMAVNQKVSPNNYDMFVERVNAAPASACNGSPFQACLVDGRFRVSVTFKPSNGPAGSGTLTPFGSDNSAIFYFFNAGNWELLLKVLDGCGLNHRFWVFYAATTNVQFTITVEDTVKHVTKTYSNAQGHTATPITDTAAFACN